MYDQNRSMAEGWLLAQSERGLEIQKFDCDPKETFRTDEEARKFVANRAMQGSLYHKSVLRMIPPERRW